MGKKQKKEIKKVPYGRKELLFNVFSLLFAIFIGLYFGGRSFYYYSKQNTKLENDSYTLNGSITKNNRVVQDGIGLHQDNDGYYFKGMVLNNYVVFANRLFRVIRINIDGSVKMISENIASEFMWGESSSYQNSNLDYWLDYNKNILGSGVYYDTLPLVSDNLIKTAYYEDVFDGKKVNRGKTEMSSYVTTLSVSDYSLANGKNSYLNTGVYFWIIGKNSNGDNYYVNDNGELLTGNYYESYGVRPVITVKADTLIICGDGTKDNPYVIGSQDNSNLVDAYVMIDGRVFKIFYDKNNILKLVDSNCVEDISYSKKGSLYDPNERNTLASYLNTTYYNSLSIKDKLLDTVVYTGELSNDTSYNYSNMYSDSVACKVGMLGIFDYQALDADDYYLSNTLSKVGNLQYVYHKYGVIEETSVLEKRKAFPFISLAKDIIDVTKGDGSWNNPYYLR